MLTRQRFPATSQNWRIAICLTALLSPMVLRAQAPAVAVVTPTDPVHLETLRTYFDEIHYGSWIRRTWAAGYAEQKKQLPAWYPTAVWDEIVKAELNMDLAAVALPVYQKYMSEDACQHAIKLFATDEGQKMAAQMFAAQDKARAEGASANSAYEQALDDQRASENQKVHAMLATVTPEDRKNMNAFMHSQAWLQVATNGAQIAKELSDAELVKQGEIMHEQTQVHHDELVAARKASGAARPPQ